MLYVIIVQQVKIAPGYGVLSTIVKLRGSLGCFNSWKGPGTDADLEYPSVSTPYIRSTSQSIVKLSDDLRNRWHWKLSAIISSLIPAHLEIENQKHWSSTNRRFDQVSYIRPGTESETSGRPRSRNSKDTLARHACSSAWSAKAPRDGPGKMEVYRRKEYVVERSDNN